MLDPLPTFAPVSWNRNDVISAWCWNADWPDKRADEFLRQHAKILQDRLIALGNEVIIDLLVSWEGPDPQAK